MAHTLSWWLLGLLALAAVPVQAQGDWQLRGFASLSVVRGGDDQLGFRRDISHDDGVFDGDFSVRADSLLGLQVNGSLAPDWDVAVQAVIRDRTSQPLLDSIEWAFLRYRPREGTDLRIGRMGTDVFMLSDYRNVGYAYPWARPVPDFYGFVPLFAFDGFDISQRLPLGEGNLYAKLYAGVSRLTTGEESEDFRLGIRPVWGVALRYERDPWRLRLSHTHARLRDDPPLGALPDALLAAAPLWPAAPALREQLRLANAQVRYSAAGIGYDGNRWQWQFELARIDSDSTLAPRADAGYLSLGRRFGAFTPYALLARVDALDPAARIELPAALPPALIAALEPLRLGAERALNATRIDQRGQSLGLRWDFAPQRALKLQWDRWRVDGDGTLLWQVPADFDAGQRRVDLWSLSLDVLF